MDAGLSGADKTTVSRTTQPISCGLPSNDLTKSLRCCSKTGGRIQEKLFDWLAKTGTALQQTLLPSELCALFMKSGIKAFRPQGTITLVTPVIPNTEPLLKLLHKQGNISHPRQQFISLRLGLSPPFFRIASSVSTRPFLSPYSSENRVSKA